MDVERRKDVDDNDDEENRRPIKEAQGPKRGRRDEDCANFARAHEARLLHNTLTH